MAILIDPDSGRASPLTARMLSDVSSSSSCSSDDVEEGGGYSSQDEAAVDVSMTPSKFVVSSDREGKRPTRRRSQCEQLSCRSRRQLVQEALRRDASRPTAPRSAPPPAAFRRWSAGPPDAVQFSSTHSYPLKPSAKNHKRSNLLAAFLASANLLLICAVIVQRIELIAHREEIAIANQHRGYMDLAKASLQQQLSTREASVKQYEHTQDRMTRLHADMAERVGTLKEELEEARVELERLREVERVAYASRAAPDDT